MGRRYRDKLLAPGSTSDGINLLRDFLGSEPDDSYFLLDKGLVVEI
jgi:Zn-dependent oligopeptidase